jgi:predicted nucleic acid-binding protein
MRTALDTNILSLFWSQSSSAATISAELSAARVEGSLVVSAPVFVELAAIPNGTPLRVAELLEEMGVEVEFNLAEDVWQLAATSFSAYAARRRGSGGGSPKRLPSDFVIGSHALLQADRLMTRDADRYKLDFPKLRLF